MLRTEIYTKVEQMFRWPYDRWVRWTSYVFYYLNFLVSEIQRLWISHKHILIFTVAYCMVTYRTEEGKSFLGGIYFPWSVKTVLRRRSRACYGAFTGMQQATLWLDQLRSGKAQLANFCLSWSLQWLSCSCRLCHLRKQWQRDHYPPRLLAAHCPKGLYWFPSASPAFF